MKTALRRLCCRRRTPGLVGKQEAGAFGEAEAIFKKDTFFLVFWPAHLNIATSSQLSLQDFDL
ncbi:hypothetical protein [Pontibacter beigongshangensis]|uniref:hypothetical protein n=1 Tax=Pontibacter beigongshangensis TaxID=2574733 RepID=UPI00164EFEA5|nr:hypothetical protein [Pontibacter beigongshangensis]